MKLRRVRKKTPWTTNGGTPILLVHGARTYRQRKSALSLRDMPRRAITYRFTFNRRKGAPRGPRRRIRGGGRSLFWTNMLTRRGWAIHEPMT